MGQAIQTMFIKSGLLGFSKNKIKISLNCIQKFHPEWRAKNFKNGRIFGLYKLAKKQLCGTPPPWC